MKLLDDEPEDDGRAAPRRTGPAGAPPAAPSPVPDWVRAELPPQPRYQPLGARRKLALAGLAVVTAVGVLAAVLHRHAELGAIGHPHKTAPAPAPAPCAAGQSSGCVGGATFVVPVSPQPRTAPTAPAAPTAPDR